MAAGPLEIRLLGRFLVVRDGEEIPAAAFGGRKVRALVRVLASRRGVHVSHDALVECLWPQRPPADPAANLGVLVNRARRALGDATLIATSPGGYAMTGDCVIDAEEFERCVSDARQAADGPRALRLYREAFDRWSGEPLAEDAYQDWSAPYRRRLIQLRQVALEEAATLAVDLGDAGLAVTLAGAAVDAEPLREVAHLTLARALAASGDPAGALAALDRCRRLLADEIGIDPSPDFNALQARMLRGDPAPRPVPTTPPAPAAVTTPTSIELAFVGRDAELASVLAAVSGPPPGVAVLAGPAGAGKTRLLAELAARLDVPLLGGRAYLPEQAEAWSLARSLLREALALDADVAGAVPQRALDAVAGVVPELADVVATPPSPVTDPDTRRALVLEGSLRMLAAAAGKGAVLVADDVQWADPSSLTLIASAVERLPQLGCVVTYRPEEMPPDGPVAAFLAGFGIHRRVTSVTLAPLTEDDVARLTDPAVAPAILAGTDGTPYAVADLIGSLAARQELIPDGRGRWLPRSPATVAHAERLGVDGQRRRLRTRLARHTAGARELLAVLALLARQAPAHTLSAATGQPHREVLAALTALATTGLVRLGEQGWTTAHDLVGETVAESLDAPERGRLHALIARALEAEDADPAEIADHHARAGDGPAAARAYLTASRALLDVSADREAGERASSGLAVAQQPDVRRQLLELRAEVRSRQGDLPGARADLRDALAGSGPGGARAQLLARLAMLYSGAEDLERASDLAESALLEARSDPPSRARALEVAAILDMNLQRPDRAASRAEAALDLYRDLGDSAGAARIMDGRAMATFMGGGVRPAVDLFGQVAHLFGDSGDLLRVVTPLSTRGHALVFLDRPADGLRETEAALALARTLGHQEGQAYALWHRSEALSALGRNDEAEADAREALAIAERLGHRGWTAMSLRALGIALAGRGELEEARAAFARSLAAAERMPFFVSWACARLALTLVASGRPGAAAPYVERALAEGPPLGHYEGRLAQVELAAARGDDGTAALAAHAARLAEDGGHLASLPRLRELATT